MYCMSAEMSARDIFAFATVLFAEYTANILIVRTTIFYRVSFIIVISSYSVQWMAGYSQW